MTVVAEPIPRLRVSDAGAFGEIFPMKRGLKNTVVGALVLAGVAVTAADVQAMPIQPLQTTLTSSSDVQHVWWRGYGWRRPFIGYGYGWRRPFYGYGWRRPFYGYGWHRPFYGYGWRRHFGWRRW